MPRVEQAGSEGPPPPFPGRTGRSRENTISIDTPGMGLTTAYLFWTSSPEVPGIEDPGGSTACAMARERRFSRMQVIEKLSDREGVAPFPQVAQPPSLEHGRSRPRGDVPAWPRDVRVSGPGEKPIGNRCTRSQSDGRRSLTHSSRRTSCRHLHRPASVRP